MLDRPPSSTRLRTTLISIAVAVFGAGLALAVSQALPGAVGILIGLLAATLVGGLAAFVSRQRRSDASRAGDDSRREGASRVPPTAEVTRASVPSGASPDREAWEALYGAALTPMLRQATLALERAGEALHGVPTLTPLLGIGHGATIRAQEFLARLRRHEPLGSALREPFPLREDIALGARALGYEVGREVVLRFSPSFPAQALADRTALRLALATLFHAALDAAEARAETPWEILIDADHDEPTPARCVIRIVVSADGGPAMRAPPNPWRERDAEASPGDLGLRGLAHLLAAPNGEGGTILANDDRRRVGLQIPIVRFKRMTGTTLYGLGAMTDRAVLVLDPRPLRRATTCEMLAAWRLLPTATANLDEALEATRVARLADRSFDAVLVAVDDLDGEAVYQDLAASLDAFRSRDGVANVVLLESIEALALPLPAALAESPALELRRVPRPPSPMEFIEVLTTLLVKRPSEPTPRTPTQGGRSILVAEDDPISQALLSKVLERRGHAVVVAKNGAELVDRLTEQPNGYDVVLMDIKMPVMDGYEATSVIRLREAQGRRARLPIIAVTAHAMAGERERCLEAGMDAYLSKPVADADLLRTIDEVIARLGPREVPSVERQGVFDRERVLEFAAGDVGFVASLVELFGTTAPRQLEQIAQGIAAGDGGAVFRAAHQLKGSIGNFGAERARALAAEVEEHGRSGRLELARERLSELSDAIQALLAALGALVDEMAEPARAATPRPPAR